MKIYNDFIKGHFYNPKKIFVSANKANIKILAAEPIIFHYREAWGEHAQKIFDSDGNLIVYSEPTSFSLLAKLWAQLNSRYAFYKDDKEILRYIHSSLIAFPDGSEIEYDYRKYDLEIDSCKIKLNENYEIVFECNRNFLYETIIIGFNSFWHPYHTSD